MGCFPWPGRLAAAGAEKSKQVALAAEPVNNCLLCHGNKDVWEGETLNRYVTEKDFHNDIHWQKGLRCVDCHGGNAKTDEVSLAHLKEDGFRLIKSPGDIPEFCGRCHADIEYMRRYHPSPRTDQLAEYWTSGHGKHLKTGDMKAATCVSCHDRPHGSGKAPGKHGILPASDLNSPVYPTHVAATCAKCHSDKKLMAGRRCDGKPLSCDEYAQWRRSVHGAAMMDKGDLSAATCNNCHGNHGALPPQVDAVANACGTCHGKNAKLFSQTLMKHKFQAAGLPGCVTCHGNHDIVHPTDAMLGMGSEAVCARCHANGKFGATIAGAEAAKRLRRDIEQLKSGIEKAHETLELAVRLGMEVSQPKFALRSSFDALTNARSLIHTFQPKPVETALAQGEKIVADAQQKGDQALQEHAARRVWLAASLAPILLVIVLLLLYIRSLPPPADAPGNRPELSQPG